MLPVTQAYLNLPPNLTVNLNEFYDGGRFLEDSALENLIRLHGNIDYRIGGNTRIKLVSRDSLEMQHHYYTPTHQSTPQATSQI